jgi:hypothetical protein
MAVAPCGVLCELFWLLGELFWLFLAVLGLSWLF